MSSPDGVRPMSPVLYGNLLAIVKDLVYGSDRIDRQSLVVLCGSRGSGKTTVLTYLASNLSDQGSEVVVLGPFDARRSTGDEYIHLIDDAVVSVSNDAARIVILLDNLDVLARSLKAADLYTFEQEILIRLVQREDVTTIATSQGPVTWRDWETRSRHQTLAIPYLSKAEVGQQAIEHEIDPDNAFWLTLGHPQILQWLFAMPEMSESEIAAAAAAYFLEGLPVDTAESATLMSLLPIFDVTVLRQAMPLAEDSMAEGFYAQYLDRVHSLIAAGILSWSADTGGYQFLDRVVRCQLARSFRLRRPEDAYRIHIRAARYYQSEAVRAGVLHLFFVTVVYHLTFTAALVDTERPGKLLLTWIEENVSRWVDARWKDVVEAWGTGAGDWVVKEELDRLLGVDDTAQITALLGTDGQTTTQSGGQVTDIVYSADKIKEEAAL